MNPNWVPPRTRSPSAPQTAAPSSAVAGEVPVSAVDVTAVIEEVAQHAAALARALAIVLGSGYALYTIVSALLPRTAQRPTLRVAPNPPASGDSIA